MSLVSIAQRIDNPVALAAKMIKPKENKFGENNGAIIPAVNQATARLVKNSEKILPI